MKIFSTYEKSCAFPVPGRLGGYKPQDTDTVNWTMVLRTLNPFGVGLKAFAFMKDGSLALGVISQNHSVGDTVYEMVTNRTIQRSGFRGSYMGPGLICHWMANRKNVLQIPIPHKTNAGGRQPGTKQRPPWRFLLPTAFALSGSF